MAASSAEAYHGEGERYREGSKGWVGQGDQKERALDMSMVIDQYGKQVYQSLKQDDLAEVIQPLPSGLLPFVSLVFWVEQRYIPPYSDNPLICFAFIP